MFRVNNSPTTYFREPYFPNKHDRLNDWRDIRRPHSEPHYHRCEQDHYADANRPDFRPDQRRRPDRDFPETRRDWDYRPDLGLRDTHRDWDYRPDLGLRDTHRDWGYRPDLGLRETYRERDCRPDRGLRDTRRDWDYRPDHRLPNTRRDRDVHPDLSPTPTPSKTQQTVGALRQLLDSLPNRKVETDYGITANDLRSGKYGKLPPSAMKELGKLDKNQDYRLVSVNSGTSMESAWVPTDGTKPRLTQSMESGGPVTATSGHPIWSLPKIMETPILSINEGITSDDLKKGAHGALPAKIKNNLSELDNNKNYTLTSLPNYMGNGETLLTWQENGTKHNYVPIESEEDRPS